MKAFFLLAVVLMWTAGLLTVMDAHASHASTESPALAKARDSIHAKRCALTEPYSPPLEICKALVAGTHTAPVPRKWASDKHLTELVYRESSYNHRAVNTAPCSAGGYARGLFQFCDNTWRGTNCKPTLWARASYQAACGYRYIKRRYGTPRRALYHWNCPTKPSAKRCAGQHWY